MSNVVVELENGTHLLMTDTHLILEKNGKELALADVIGHNYTRAGRSDLAGAVVVYGEGGQAIVAAMHDEEALEFVAQLRDRLAALKEEGEAKERMTAEGGPA